VRADEVRILGDENPAIAIRDRRHGRVWRAVSAIEVEGLNRIVSLVAQAVHQP
jgi:hypothetical protein